MENILQRRCLVLTVRAGRKQDQLQVIAIANTGDDHNESEPSPLPRFTKGKGTTTVTTETSDENDMGIGVLDFAKVADYKVVTARNKLVGVSFFDTDDECLATVKFRDPLDKVDDKQISIWQYMVIGALSADMEFLSILTGHQGASATWPCIYNLAKLSDVKKMWEGTGALPSFIARTADNIWESWQEYKTRFCDKDPSERTSAARANVTKNHSHSIAMEPCCYFPMDSVIPAVMHVRLGVARSLLDFDFDFYGKIAELAEEGNHAESRHAIEETIRHLKIYLEELDFAQADVLESLEGRDKQENNLLDRMGNARKVVEAESLAQETREKWKAILEGLEREYDILVNGDADETQDDKLLKKQMLEQSCMVKNTIDELQRIHNKYSCFSQVQVTIGKTLKEFNVDTED